MRTRRVVVVVAVVAAVGVILATSYLASDGRLQLPWPQMHRQILGGDRGFMRSSSLAAAGPYVESIAGLLLQFLIGVLVVYAAPERMRRLSDALAAGGRDMLRHFVIGLLLALGLGAVAVLSAFFVQTFLLPFVLTAVYFLAALVGGVGLAFALGRGLLRRTGWAGGSPLVSLFVGTLPLYAATRIPFVALVVIGGMALIGAGVALSTRFGGRRTWSLDPLREVIE